MNWDYSKERLHKVDSFDFQRFLRIIAKRIEALTVFDVSTPNVTVSVQTERETLGQQHKAQDNILAQLQNLDDNIPPQLQRASSKFNFTLSLTFDILSLNTCT